MKTEKVLISMYGFLKGIFYLLNRDRPIFHAGFFTFIFGFLFQSSLNSNLDCQFQYISLNTIFSWFRVLKIIDFWLDEINKYLISTQLHNPVDECSPCKLVGLHFWQAFNNILKQFAFELKRPCHLTLLLPYVLSTSTHRIIEPSDLTRFTFMLKLQGPDTGLSQSWIWICVLQSFNEILFFISIT